MKEEAIEVELTDNDTTFDCQLPIKIVASPRGISIEAKGYGDCGSTDGHGSPIFLEFFQGRFRLLVWSDITNEDPTHIIDLTGAREDRRYTRR